MVQVLGVRRLRMSFLRQLKPGESQRWAGIFFIIGVFFGLGFLSIKYAKHFWDSASRLSLTAATAAVVFMLFFGALSWGKHVPEKVSWWLGGIVWALLFLLALTGHIE